MTRATRQQPEPHAGSASDCPLPAGARDFDLDRFIDHAPLGRFHARIVFWPFVVMLADGFDLVVMGYALPGIVAAWHIDRATMGPVLSASLFGMLCGTPLAGFAGDRLGRRPMIIASLLLFGAATGATVFATEVGHLVALRFVAGLGLAGVIPNATALVSEYAPRRARGTLLVAMQAGVQGGAIVAGLAATYLVAAHGWQVLFRIGGAWPVVLAVALAFVLPESAKFLALRPDRRPRLLRVVRQLDPFSGATAQTRFVTAGSGVAASLSPVSAFRFGMHWITPLLWGLVSLSLFSNLLFLGWAPSILQDLGIDAPNAALMTSLFGVGGLLGSAILAAAFNRFGFLALAGFECVGVAAMALIGQPFVGKSLLPFVVVLAGISVSGPQSALNSALGMLYPTPIRGASVGWGIAVGRMGSIAGPLVGGLLVSHGVGSRAFFEILALPCFAALALACVLAALCRRRFASWRLDDHAVPAAGAPAAPGAACAPAHMEDAR